MYVFMYVCIYLCMCVFIYVCMYVRMYLYMYVCMCKLDLNLRKKLIKCYIWSMALYGADTWALRAADQKYLESFEMWCWRRMENISWTDHMRSEEVLLRVNEQRNILQEIRKRKASWIGHILRRNCLLKQVVEGKIKGRWKWQEDEEEDVRSYWMTLRTGGDILI